MKKFNYTMNHKADEAYMAKMCDEGFAAKSLVEGVWTFEPCRPDQYVYRVCYLRGKSPAEVDALKQELAAKGIEFVSKYSFWAIFRSEQEFELYTQEEEIAICEKIRRPMIPGAILSWLVFAVTLVLGKNICGWIWILSALLAVYGGMCTCLGISYTKLLKKLRR